MSCKVDGKSCDGNSKVCRLNPVEKNPFYYDDMTGVKRIFWNYGCSNFVKVDGFGS